MLLQIKINTRSRTQMMDITSLVQREISQKRVSEGVCIVYVPHTTAGITLAEKKGLESGLSVADIELFCHGILVG